MSDCSTALVVDLAAVARERLAMAATLVRFPDLLTPAARERCAVWLERDVMKRLDPSNTGETAQLAVRLPAPIVAKLDAEVARLSALAPGATFSRSDAVRSILVAYQPPGAQALKPATASPPPLTWPAALAAVREAASKGTGYDDALARASALAGSEPEALAALEQVMRECDAKARAAQPVTPTPAIPTEPPSVPDDTPLPRRESDALRARLERAHAGGKVRWTDLPGAVDIGRRTLDQWRRGKGALTRAVASRLAAWLDREG